MDKRALYDEFGQIELDIKQLLDRLNEMKHSAEKLMEQNVNLEIENRHLRERLLEYEANESKDASDERQRLSKSRLNLEKIYEEGFHVCNVCYGTRRENDEECAFCLDVIYGERK
ncbi:DNA replication initiation control protein YabA [Vagococcus sp.]|uniref:DNA replication initiation control protein YabA n=1 Tax=Vagococcus sp. TaxID=1933889 RepID=UPI000EE9AD7B|nr:DNA replication initiation control protein YabA [Vagococcus sp.]HCT96636.1 DNA replication initiation control protein YabA [Vagococcus sp.]